MDDHFVYKNGKKLKCGYTTGSCAAGAAKAAAIMLSRGENPQQVAVATPAGITLNLPVKNHSRNRSSASCCIVKDGGDDHDVTHGLEICAEVSKRTDGKIKLTGGEGVGTITRDGFWGKTGETAINPVPRKMILEEVSKISDCGWNIVISVPQGRQIAKKTLNSKIGIQGGISIIGTTGIVEPMSVEAFKKTIFLEIEAIRQEDATEILLYLGNYGRKVAADLNLNLPSVKISNFIGEALLYCQNQQFDKICLIGHIGKLCKLSIGVFNTHSKVSDVRIEAFIYYLALAGADREIILNVSQCKSSEEALQLIMENGKQEVINMMHSGCKNRIEKYVKNASFDLELIIYSMDYGILKRG